MYQLPKFVLLLLFCQGVWGESLQTTDKCTCDMIISLTDCQAVTGCGWNYTTSQCLKSEDLPKTQPAISVLCSGLSNPETQCRLTIGCAYISQNCIQFAGCTSYMKTTNDDCQAIQSQCTTDGTSCIDIKECKDYSQTLCSTNTSSSGSKKCVWDTTTNICRDQICSEAPNTYNTNSQCNNFKNGCVTNGYGCADTLGACATFTTNCDKYIGTDGYCEAGDVTCKPKSCASAPDTTITDADCEKIQKGCVTTGKGCQQSPLLSCSTYSSDCENMIGNEGKCAKVNDVCAARECSQVQYSSDKECKDYKSECLSDGVKCVTNLSLCSTYSGTIEQCLKYKGSDGLCTRTDATSPGECRAKLCSEAPSNYNLDTQCSAYQTGCVTNGLGCVSIRAACQTYTSNCDKYIGSDGKCSSPPTGSSNTNCIVLACSMAPATYVSNKECTDFLSGCVSTGGGCQVQKQCELSQKEVTCNGTNNCNWSSVCVTNQCSNLNNIAQCAVNNKCTWNGSTCVEISCTSAPNTLKTNDECQQFRNGCITTYAGCISSDAPCSSYNGDYATCNKYIGNGKICSRGSTGTGACNDRICSNNTIATSTTDCDLFMKGCLSKGTGCIDPSLPCTSYTGTKDQCLLFRGERGVKKCSNDGTTVAQCRNAVCSDDNTDTTDAACSSFLSGCVTKGIGCIESTAQCSSFSGQNANQCGAYKSGACWWVSGSACVDRQCVHQTTATSDSECSTFMSGCMFNGTQGCITKSSACSVFSGDESKCQQFYGNYIQCTRKDACANKVCSEKIDATSQSDCMNYTSGCRYNGTSTCIDSQSICTNYNITNTEVCQNITDINGNKCWSGTTTCIARQCSQLTTSTSQAICDAFLSGCVFTGTACATKSSSCASYLNFTQDACKVATRMDGQFCWKETTVVGTCEERQCTNTLSAYSESLCLSHLSTCVYTGTACAAKQVNCSSYINFTQDGCKNVKNVAGDLCWRSSATSAPCQDRSCSDTLTTFSAADCKNHKSTCKYNGSICVDTQSSCSSYASFTQEACQNVTQLDGTSCWKADASVGNCVLRTCALAPTIFKSSTACPQFLSTCRYNGSSCVDQQSTCASYTSFTQAACRQVSTSTGILCWMTAAGPGACIDRTCTDTIASPSASVCSSYLLTCRFSGSACVAQQANCSSYADFTESACQEVTNSSGVKCWSSTSTIGPCKNRACTDAILSPSDTTCNAHLSGCIFDNASACVQGQSSCEGYTTACRTVKATNGRLCWNSSSGSNCKTRECTDNTDAINDETCESFLSGCVTNGKGCVSKSTTCAQFTGTSQGCLGYTGNGIRCKGGVSTTGTCSQRYCNDNTSATTDAECSAFMSGCVTNLKGCISSNESCSSYSGTQATCAKFTGGGKKCWNVASATSVTACTIRKCEDNTTATTDSECSNFQTQCVTNLRGCLPSTSPCTAFTGTYAECIQFTGNGIKCSNDATAITTQSCKTRVCSHNTIATTDSECDSFLNGCVTTLRGCVAPQACSLFVGTAEQCSKVSATDKPCTGGTTSGACYKLTCSSAPNTYVTDLQCQQYKSGCVTNGKGCVDSSTCEEIQSPSGCQGRAGCLYIPSCRTVQASCSMLATPSICVSTPILTGRCTWANNVCRNWECQDASASSITHDSCQLLSKSCTTTGYGCINMSTCSTYTTQYVCSIAHTTEQGETCVWDSVSCRAKKCEDAPKSYNTDTLCQGFIGTGSGCKTNGYGCLTPPFSCSQLVVRSKCTYDSSGKPCLWFPNKTVKCEQYAQCTDIVKTTYAECQEYSTYCTTDGIRCIPLSSCGNYSSQSACTIDIAGDKCGWLQDKCVKYTQCDSAVFSDNTQCQAYSKQCVTDGTKCINTSTCDKYVTQVACSNNGSDGKCIWDNNSCRLQKCEDAVNITTYGQCQSFISTCTLNSTSNGCIQFDACSTYTQTNCFKGKEGKCFWTGEVCKVFECTDLKLNTTAGCQVQDSTCISNGLNCMAKGLCSSYVTVIACNSGGTDGVCAYNNSQCKLMSSCNDAGSDQIACQQKSQFCNFISGNCQDHTCTSIASGGSCNPLINFTQTTFKICALNLQNICVESEGQYLSSTTCLSLSNYAYSWNPINNTCHKCNNYISNNGTNNNNTNNTNNSTNSTHESIILLTIVILLLNI